MPHRLQNDLTNHDTSDMRPGEIAVAWSPSNDASLDYIGILHTPWAKREDCPRQGDVDGPLCKIEIFQPWDQGLVGLIPGDEIELLYWMHLARRDVVLQKPHSRTEPLGVFALRSPMRPNPIAASTVRLVAIENRELTVRGLDCLDGTPLLDIKPKLKRRAERNELDRLTI